MKIIPALAIWSECPEKGDISDIADKLGDKKAQELLIDAIHRTEPYTPSAKETKADSQEAKENKRYVSPYDADGTGTLTIKNLKAYMEAKGYRVYYDEISRRFVYDGFKGKSKLHIEEIAPVLIYDELQFELKKCSVDKIENNCNRYQSESDSEHDS